MKMNHQTNWAGFIDESSNRPDCSAVAGLAIRQLDIFYDTAVKQLRCLPTLKDFGAVVDETILEGKLASSHSKTLALS